MLSLFPPPGPPLPPFSSLLVQGPYHSSAPIHLALGHVLQSPEHEALVISPSPSKFKQKLSAVLDQGSLNTNRMKTAMTRIIIIYPPSPAHLCLLISTLDGTQTASELTCLWGSLPVSPTEDLSLIILDDISTLFIDVNRDPPALSFLSIMNRLRQSISRITTNRVPISVACFETTPYGHLEGVKSDLFDLIVEFEEVDILTGQEEMRTRKRISTWNRGERTSIEVTWAVTAMHPFASYVLRTYYKATGWNEDNLYANLTRSSNAILDFTVPRGLHFSISKSPNPLFKTTYSMTAMPSLNGSVGYIFTSCDLNVMTSRTVPFKEMIERFRVYDQPRRPEAKEEVWHAGERVDQRDYLMYGRFYLPTARLDALYSTRLSPTVQAMVAAISDPPSNVPTELRGRNTNVNNIMISLQHDVGKCCTEYNYSAEDSMWGVRFLYNFGRLGIPPEPSEEAQSQVKIKRVDAEDAVGGGLRGRVSIGAELYFSAKEKSAGVSTGVRFTTLPDATPPSAQLPSPSTSTSPSPIPLSTFQPPTTATCLFNPMLGHVSAAYTARTSRDLAFSTRFDFNVYSFESEWTMGAEYWLRRRPPLDEEETSNEPSITSQPDVQQEVHGVLKAKMSTNNDVSLMWEGRIRNMLVSLGLVSDLSSRAKPIKAIGLELSYFSSE